jgi:hypothetical protein
MQFRAKSAKNDLHFETKKKDFHFETEGVITNNISTVIDVATNYFIVIIMLPVMTFLRILAKNALQ